MHNYNPISKGVGSLPSCITKYISRTDGQLAVEAETGQNPKYSEICPWAFPKVYLFSEHSEVHRELDCIQKVSLLWAQRPQLLLGFSSTCEMTPFLVLLPVVPEGCITISTLAGALHLPSLCYSGPGADWQGTPRPAVL